MDRSEGRYEEPDRGPLLIIDGEKDHTVPWAIANAAPLMSADFARALRAVGDVVAAH